ncbi:MAG: hypothetical protein ACRDAP_19035, partial [Shewanella sp.]
DNVFLRDINKLGDKLHAKLNLLVEQNGEQATNRIETLAMEALVQMQAQFGVDDQKVTDLVNQKMDQLKSLTRNSFASEGRYRNELLGMLHSLQEAVGTPAPPPASDTVRQKMRDAGTDTDGIGSQTGQTGVDQATGDDGADAQQSQAEVPPQMPRYPSVLQPGADQQPTPTPPTIPDVQYPLLLPYDPNAGYFIPATYFVVPFFIPQQPQSADAAAGPDPSSDSDSDSDSDLDDDDTSGMGCSTRTAGVSTGQTQTAAPSAPTADSDSGAGGGSGTGTGTTLSSTPAATQTDPIPRDGASTQPIKGRVRSFLDISLEAASNANDMTMQSGVNPFAKAKERYRSSLFFPLGGDDRARMASQTTYELLTSGADEAGDTDGGGGQPQSGPESFISSAQLLKAKTVAFDS